MYRDDTREQIESFQKSAIEIMHTLGIPVTPHNYTVWYRYVRQEEPELVSVIDALRQTNDRFTHDMMDSLFLQFCEDINERELIRLRDELQEMVTELYRTVSDLSGESSGFTSTMIECANELNEVESVQEIRVVVARIVDQARLFGEKSARVEEGLDTVQLELDSLRAALSLLQEEVRRDELTGIANRKAFDEALARQISLSRRRNRVFSVIMVDIDHFKLVNDTYGHLIGDQILKYVAQRIDVRVRHEDIAARFGGEEFIVLLPETGSESALMVAEGIRQAFENTSLRSESGKEMPGTVTVSAGVTEYQFGESASDLVARVDSALYKAKNNGRNQVCLI